MNTIRLVITPQIEKMLTFLEKEYSPLSRAEILKMIIGATYKQKKQEISVTSSDLVKEDTINYSKKQWLSIAAHSFNLRTTNDDPENIDWTKVKPYKFTKNEK